MISECANPSCRIEFEYGRGQFFRFRKAPKEDGRPANIHSVQHFWLCHQCANSYRLDYEQNKGVLLKPSYRSSIPASEPLLVGAA